MLKTNSLGASKIAKNQKSHNLRAEPRDLRFFVAAAEVSAALPFVTRAEPRDLQFLVAAAEVSTAPPFVIPSEAEGSAVLFPYPRPFLR
jgi:hypothetical protein